MDRRLQAQKARDLLALHLDPKLLVLPNVWDPLGARMLERLGYPAVATASAAVAYSLGYDDGERIGFATMRDAIERIATSVSVPVTADIEKGYAELPGDVAENVRQVIYAGAVGVNIEDSNHAGSELFDVRMQCARIAAIRALARDEGVPLVINARTDVFMIGAGLSAAGQLEEGIARARAYLGAGADCIYPITVGDIDTLTKIRSAIGAPLNVYASASTAPMHELEAAGISRLSLGPGLLKASLATMRDVALALRDGGSYESFTANAADNAEIEGYLARG